MQRLGKNAGGYFGETMDLNAVLKDLKTLGDTHGWHRELICKTSNLDVFALHRKTSQPARRIYISAGIHGDEPAGPLAALQLLRDNDWPSAFEYWLCPCLNPTGFFLNSRENQDRKDLNRDYRDPETEEVAAHIRWLERQPNFDAAFCLHEDWESHGFYLYELNPNGSPSLAEKMVAAAGTACPIDLSPVIEGREAHGGIIRPNMNPAERPKWPEAFWLLQNKTRLVYTLEAPSDFPLAARVQALVAALKTALPQLA